MGFDPSQPFEPVTPGFDPGQPFERVGFDPAQPFTRVEVLTPENFKLSGPQLQAASPWGDIPGQPQADLLTALASDPVAALKSIPDLAFGIAAAPGKLAYHAAADVVSKIAGQPEYGGNLMAPGGDRTPAEKFIAGAARTNPKLAVVANVAKSLPELASMMAINPTGTAGRLLALGFSADMIHKAGPLFDEYAAETAKPPEEQDPGKVADLTAGILQTFAFAPLAAAHGFGEPLNAAVTQFRTGLDNALRQAPGIEAPPVVDRAALRRGAMPAEEGAPVPAWVPDNNREVVKSNGEVKNQNERAGQGLLEPTAPEPPPWALDYGQGGEMPRGEAVGGPVAEGGNARAASVEPAAAPAKPETPATAAAKVAVKSEVKLAETPAVQQKSRFDGKAAKEQKKFLLEEADKALAEAPEDHPVVPADADLLAVKDFEHYKAGDTKESFEQRRAQVLDPLFEQYQVPFKDPALGNGIPYEDRYQRLETAIRKVQYQQRPKITIEVPGDGTFDVLNSKGALAEFKARAAKFPTSAPRPKLPSQTRTTPTPAAAVGKLDKPTTLKALKNIVSTDTTRGQIVNVWSDGKQTVATDGRRLTIINEGVGGTKAKPGVFTPEGREVKIGKDDPQFPHWQQVVPTDFKSEVKALDTERLFTILRQAQEATSEKARAVTVWLNKDGSLGVTAHAPDLAAYNHNVFEDSKPLFAADPQYFIDALNVARMVGDKKINLRWTDELAPYEIVGQNSRSVVMPMRMSGDANVWQPKPEITQPKGKAPKAAKGVVEPPPVLTTEEVWRKQYAQQIEKLRGSIRAGQGSSISVASEALRTAEMLGLGKGVVEAQLKQAGMAQHNIDYALSSYKPSAQGAEAASPSPEPPKPEIIGMGGAVPGEFVNSAQTPTSIKNAVVDAERAKRGLPPAMEAGRKEFGQSWDEAMARLDVAPDAAALLVQELKANPRALSDVENALLLQRQVELQNAYGKATRDLAAAYDDAQSFPNRLADVEAGKARAAALSDQLLELYDVNRAVGTEQGRGLAARKMLAYEDYTLAKMEMEKRAAKGGAPLSDAERAELTRLQQRIEQTQKAFDAYREQQEQARANRMTDEAIADMQRELANRPQYDSRIVKIAEEIVSKLEKQADQARLRLADKFKRTSAGVDPTIIYDLGVIGAAKIARLGLDVTRFGVEMVKEFGEGVREYLPAAWERANLHLENEGAKYGDKAPAVKNLLRKRDAASKRENVVAGLQKGKAEGLPVQMEGDYIRKLTEALYESGIRTREPLIDAVHKILTEEVGLDISRRETMDAISGYGKYKALDPNATKAALRDLRGQMQQVAKLEDIQNRTPLKKTGVQRREPSNEERRLLQQVNEAKRRFGVVVSDPARQLKSALDAIKTRLKNSIADLEYQLNTKARIVKTKSPSPFDAETQLLETRRDELKRQLDELVPRPGLTVEQQVAQVARGLERSIAEFEQRIASGDVLPRASRPALSTPALEALRAKRNAVRDQLAELRDASEAYQRTQHEAAIVRESEALKRSIADKEAALAAGPQPPEWQPVNRPADPRLEELIQQREALNRKLADMRRKPEAQKHAEATARQLQTILSAIAEREAKLAAGDLSPVNRPRQVNRPLPPDLEIAKQRLEELNQQLAEARRGPKKSPEEVALSALKARLAQSTADHLARLARHDFAPRKRNNPVALDGEALKLKAENEIAKREYHRGLILDRLANRTTGQKVFAGVKEALNLPRNIMASWDVSAVLRQGGFIVTGNPWRGLRNLAPMFRSLASEKASVMVEQEILSRPNAPLYKQAGLYLAPHEALHLSSMEEAMMSRLAGKIPGLRASNRAYITFLNRLRADSFDAMVGSIARKNGNLNRPELQAVANFINVATGRGDLGRASAAAETLATVFFAPRLVASRFQLLAAQPLYRGSWRTRQAIAMEYGKFLAGMAVVYGLGTLAGASVETDPRSADFAKLRFGNTRVDVLGGLGQVSVLTSRLVSGSTKTAQGDVRPIRGEVPYGSSTAADVVANFMRAKLSPVVGNALDLATGKNVVGEPVTPGSVAQNMIMPLSFRDIYTVMREQGMATGTALGILSLFGAGLQYYQTPVTDPLLDRLMRSIRGVPPEERKAIREELSKKLGPPPP